MNILVLGATGGVGRLVVKQALAGGHKVTAFVRHDPGNIALDGATVACGNVLDTQALSNALAGQEAVVYAIGVKSTGSTTLFSQSTRLLLSAMEQNGALPAADAIYRARQVGASNHCYWEGN